MATSTMFWLLFGNLKGLFVPIPVTLLFGQPHNPSLFASLLRIIRRSERSRDTCAELLVGTMIFKDDVA